MQSSFVVSQTCFTSSQRFLPAMIQALSGHCHAHDVTSRLRWEASRSQLNGSAQRAPAHWRRIHSPRADDNYIYRWRASVTSLNVIAERDADWLRAALTGSHCFSSCWPADRPPCTFCRRRIHNPRSISRALVIIGHQSLPTELYCFHKAHHHFVCERRQICPHMTHLSQVMTAINLCSWYFCFCWLSVRSCFDNRLHCSRFLPHNSISLYK